CDRGGARRNEGDGRRLPRRPRRRRIGRRQERPRRQHRRRAGTHDLQGTEGEEAMSDLDTAINAVRLAIATAEALSGAMDRAKKALDSGAEQLKDVLAQIEK